MKITPDHLARGAFIYIRQSTVDQLADFLAQGTRAGGTEPSRFPVPAASPVAAWAGQPSAAVPPASCPAVWGACPAATQAGLPVPLATRQLRRRVPALATAMPMATLLPTFWRSVT